MMKLIYIASPYAGDVEYNTRMAIKYCRYAVNCAAVPIAPHLLFPLFLQDSHPEKRKKGIEMGLRLLICCGELWVFGNFISEGMRREIDEAKKLNIPVKHIKSIENKEVISKEL